jgi:hypothetical protein
MGGRFVVSTTLDEHSVNVALIGWVDRDAGRRHGELRDERGRLS